MGNFEKPVNGVPRGTAMALTDLPSIANNTLIGNNSGSASTPSALTSSQVLTILGLSTLLALTNSITQAAHGFSVGNVLYYTGSAWALAKADQDSTSEVLGIVSSVTSSSVFVLTQIGYITGLSGLTAGAVHYLSDTTAGALTTTGPSTIGHVNKPVLVADTTTSGYIIHSRGIDISPPASGIVRALNPQTGSTYTFVLSDGSQAGGNTLVTGNNASTQTYTVPANSSVNYPVGTQIDVLQLGAGKITMSPAGGVTINSLSGNLSTGGQYVAVSLIQYSLNTWVLIGNLQA
jgi:hypothetical protein